MSTETQHDLKQYEEATATAVMESSAIAPPQNKSGEEEKEQSQSQKLMAKVKEAGTAGIVSYALWELAFWFISIPVCILGYQKVTGHWPDLSNGEDQAQLGAEGKTWSIVMYTYVMLWQMKYCFLNRFQCHLYLQNRTKSNQIKQQPLLL